MVNIPSCFVNHKRLVIFNLSGDGGLPDHQHADSTSQLFPGAAAVLLSNRGSRGSAAGAPNPSQSHRQAWQHTQVLQHKVCLQEHGGFAGILWGLNWSVLELSCTSVTICVNHRAFFLCSIISDISVLKLKVDKCSRQDNLFMKKVKFTYKYLILWWNCWKIRALKLPSTLSVCLSSDSSFSSCILLTAWPAAVPTHLPGLQGAEQRSEALRDPLRSVGPSQCGAGQRRGGGGPHSPGARLAGTDARNVFYLLASLFCLEIIPRQLSANIEKEIKPERL